MTSINAGGLGKKEVVQWLLARGELQEELFSQARAVRQASEADGVHLRGVIEYSSYCEKSCDYCAMRCRNNSLERYRLSPAQILAIASEIKAHGISTVFLQGGQDHAGDPILEEVIPQLKTGMGLNVLLCVGERSPEIYRRFAKLGAGAYILKFETSDPALYKDIGGSFHDRRMKCLSDIRKAGMRLGSGCIAGLPGQSVESLAEDYLCGVALQPDFISVSPFIPNEGTPFEGHRAGDLDTTLNLMALWRIALKNVLIPAVSALEKIGKEGQLRGLQAGANVLTINFTPDNCREKYAIYSEHRFIVSKQHALGVIERAGLKVHGERASSS